MAINRTPHVIWIHSGLPEQNLPIHSPNEFELILLLEIVYSTKKPFTKASKRFIYVKACY